MVFPDDFINQVICGDCFEVMAQMPENSVDSIVTDPPYGLSFMGKDWDHGVPGVHFWTEVLRVAKPGAHMLAFGGTRTFHRLICAIEDAGWEIRDTLGWLHGQGFPKSHNAAIAITKKYNPDWQQGQPLSIEAMPWQGWGTALKPAWEPIILARKPLIGTVAKNVLEYGTGAINVDGCRIYTDDKLQHGGPLRTNSGDTRSGKALGMFQDGTQNTYEQNNLGRWPANILHDGSEEVMEVFPNSSVTGNRKIKNRVQQEVGQTPFTRGQDAPEYVDSGSAARFFYCAKASKQDRDEGCEGMDEINFKKWNERPGNRGIADKYPDGSPRPETTARNNHPTVKPTDLMRYLCRLITPPNGIILDPFAGSGSTGKAAKLEGFNFILIEKESQYCEIARKRIAGTLVTKKLPFPYPNTP